MASCSFGAGLDLDYMNGSSGGDGIGYSTFVPKYSEPASENEKSVLVALTNCVVMFGRKIVDAGTLEVSGSNGRLCAKIEHPTYGQSSGSSGEEPVVTLVFDDGESTNLYTLVPLYNVVDGAIESAYRDMPVIPVYN